MSTRRGPPKHQNRFAWKPDAGKKKNETEVGGKLRPYSEITGVCPRCRDQIDWKRRYGKYKPLVEPVKCQRCGKRAVRQAYHNLCSGCAKEFKVCAKCSCRVEQIVGRNVEELEAEQKMLDEAIKNARERDRRTLLRAMNKNKTSGKTKTPQIAGGSREGDLLPAKSLEEYANLSREKDGDDDAHIHEDHDHDCDNDGSSRSDNDDEDEDGDGENDDGDSENGGYDDGDGKEDEDDGDDNATKQQEKLVKLGLTREV